MDLFRFAPGTHAGTSNAPDSITDNSASFVDRGGALPAPVAFIKRRFAPQFENTSKKKELQQPSGPGVAVGFRGRRRFISRAASNAPVRCMTDSRDGGRAANLLLPLRCVAVAHRSPSIIPSKLLVLLCMMQAASSVIHNSRGCMAWFALLSRSEPFFIADISGKMRRALL
jgi:hypothetical protein